jgi:hypothetical protein
MNSDLSLKMKISRFLISRSKVKLKISRFVAVYAKFRDSAHTTTDFCLCYRQLTTNSRHPILGLFPTNAIYCICIAQIILERLMYQVSERA